jgi:hypothetical protein
VKFIIYPTIRMVSARRRGRKPEKRVRGLMIDDLRLMIAGRGRFGAIKGAERFFWFDLV